MLDFSCDSLHFLHSDCHSLGQRHDSAVAQNHYRSSANRPCASAGDVLGFRPGDDRKLASWAKVVEYFQKLAAASDRVKFAELERPRWARHS